MFEITFEYTPEELKEIRRLNKVLVFPKWKSVGVAVLSVLPSVFLLLLTKSFIIIASAIVLAVFLAAWLVKVFLDSEKLPEEPPMTMIFSEDGKKETQRNSVFEFKWLMFDESFESETAYFIRRLDAHALIPKRSIPAENVEEFEGYLKKVGRPPPAGSSPVEMYSELASADPEEIVEFQYQADDLLKIGNTWSELSGKPTEPEVEGSTSLGWFVVFVAVLMSMFLIWQLEHRNNLDYFQVALITVAVVLPFFVLHGLSKVITAFSKSTVPKVPNERNQSVLLKNGWIVGGPDNMSLYEWRDVDKIFDNETCYGLKLASNQIIIIPKRIFASETLAKRFIDKAIDQHREYRRGFDSPVTSVETGNPYQSPLA